MVSGEWETQEVQKKGKFIRKNKRFKLLGMSLDENKRVFSSVRGINLLFGLGFENLNKWNKIYEWGINYVFAEIIGNC